MRPAVRISTFAALAFTFFLTATAQFAPPAQAQETGAPAQDNQPADQVVEKWDRLIYVPFKELQKVFENQEASAVVPYAEYLELLKSYLNQQDRPDRAPDAVITESRFNAVVEKDVVRIQAELTINVLRPQGWARLPIQFGKAAIGKVTAQDDTKVILQGIGTGQYSLLLNGPGLHTVTIDLLATVRTSPEARSFQINCPPVGISELTLTIPEADQTVTVNPLQVLLPVEGSNNEQTVVRASLGSTDQFEVQWNPRAGSKPVMDLLASVSNVSNVQIEPGLVQTNTKLSYEVLRGELREVTVNVPADARIIDINSTNGRIRSWEAQDIGDTHQQVVIELLTPASGRFDVDLQIERNMTGDSIQLVGKSADEKLQGIHADGVVRESGRIIVSTDSSLTLLVTSQSGMKRVDAGAGGQGPSAANRQAWEFSGTTGQLVVQTKPVEPRILVHQGSRLVFGDDELRLHTQLVYTVERAGVFQLPLKFPESLTIDTVQADGMSEFNVDKESGQLTLSLTQRRMGNITVEITAHQAFDSTADNVETELPTITPVGVERETGRIGVFAPRFLDAVTVDDKLSGLFPAESSDPAAIGRAVRVSSWNYTQRPFSITVRTSPRPAQLAATVATTAKIDPDIVRIDSLIELDIRNAGLDTYRIAVPEAIADSVRFESANTQHVIQQRNKAAEAVDGWVAWTLVLQNEVTGTVRLTAKWEITIEGMEEEGATQSIVLQPPQVLLPFTDEQADKRRVTLTQAKGEIRLLRHESLSISAEDQAESTEAIDIRELELLEQQGYLAFRYFSQPASTTISIRKHEVHEVVATVVSRSAIEIVTEKQQLANYRCRFLITSSERQRLRIDLPTAADLQSPTLAGQRTTFEPATDVTAEEGWDAYYVNISRSTESDQSFLLSFQFRCPITEQDVYPFSGNGGRQILRLPALGEGGGDTVVQETRVAVWTPEDVAQFGKPDNWTVRGHQPWFTLSPLKPASNQYELNSLDEWIGQSGLSTADFARQGGVTIYRALGHRSAIRIAWWNRPFLVGIVCGVLILIGILLRTTSWENRISLVLVMAVVVVVWSLKDHSAATLVTSSGTLGLLAIAAIWLIGLVFGNHQPPDKPSPSSDAKPSPPSDANPAPQPADKPKPAVPPGTVSPSPEVAKDIDNLMGGGK